MRFDQLFVPPDATVRDAIEAIDAGAIEIALVVDGARRLIGTVSDGDVRRALLAGTTLDDAVEPVMHPEPTTAPVGTDVAELIGLMTRAGIEQIPLLEDDVVTDVAFLRDLVGPAQSEHYAVIMAGGEGRRLRPLTDDLPKPMLPVGDRPLLETVLGQVREAGFSKVLIAVNYRREVIQDHFEDGKSFGVDIEYIEEPAGELLGSAGALRLAREQLDRPFVVVNADVLTNVNLAALLAFHREERAVLTVGVRQYVLEVPYGVVEIEGTRVTALREKPQLPLFVNAGIYAVSPDAMKLIPDDVDVVNMTDIIDATLAAGERVASFPVREYWLDVGHIADYERAHEAHATYFSADK